MSIISTARGASVWRGYEYYKAKKIKSFIKKSNDEYEGIVAGGGTEPYHVKINISQIRQSKCNCPHADGKRIICKHMVALFFTAFPGEADKYIKEVMEYEREEEEREKEYYEDIKNYVYNLSKEELRQELIKYIIETNNNGFYL